MKIAIAIFGIPRGSFVTKKSIINNIVEQANKVGETKLFGHLFRLDAVKNARSNESGFLVEDDYARFHEFNSYIEEPNRCLDEWDFNFFTQFYDLEGDNYQSNKNLIHQLHSLLSVTKQIELYDPDVVIFARPDLLYHQPISQSVIELAGKYKNRIYLPDWQWWNGYNDRFAICSKFAYKVYGCRVLEAKQYCTASKLPLHAERLLRFTLNKNNIAVRTISTCASRVRTGNVVKSEDFDPIITLGTASRRLKLELRLLQALSIFNF